MTKYKIVLIIPYFGKFPNYFQLWLDSCSYNKDYSFYIYTDIQSELYEIPSNVRFIKSSLELISKRASNVLNKNVIIDKSYKLCDFRPLYGLIFSDDIREFDFWGHCDIDLIFGNISYFLNDEIFDKFDKILTCGHFSLYRNSSKLTNIFLNNVVPNYMEVFTSDKNQLFDEGLFSGLISLYEKKRVKASNLYDNHRNINQILYDNSIPIYTNFDIYADINIIYDGLRIVWGSEISTRDPNSYNSFFYYEDVHVRRMVKGGNRIDEFMYIHLQKRKMEMRLECRNMAFLIKSHSFEDLPQLTPNRIKELCKEKNKGIINKGIVYSLFIFRIHYYLSKLKYKTGINFFALFFWKKI